MMKLRVIYLFLLFGIADCTFGQHSKEFKRIFNDAGYLYETGFYEEAFNRYKNLLTLDPGNSNILFRCGACCLHIPGNEQQAVTYLQEASEGVTEDFRDNRHNESGAPVLTWFLLGKAYHLNYRFQEAIQSYDTYLARVGTEDPLQVAYANVQKEACIRAGELLEEPPGFEFSSVLDQFDEELPSCNNPVISGDGDLLVFLVDYPNDRKIMETRRQGEYWTRPRVINSEIGMVGETFPVSLSFDGQDLYLAHHFYSHSDIFVTHYQGGRWTQAEALGNNINGRTSETHASISKDGNSLYFTTDARGGQGSFDIYVSRRDGKGDWGAPSNLGPEINTRFEEHTPFISANDSILFFSSQGHTTFGGFDVFYSELGPDGKWGPPQSLGYPVNTVADNLFFNPGWDELDGYYAVRRENDPTSNTINMVIKLDPPEHAEDALTVKDILMGKEAEKKETRQPVPEKQVPSTIIEPEVTDEIHEALNRAPETARIVPAAGTGQRMVRTGIPFEHNAYQLGMGAMLEAEKVADLLQSHPHARVVLTGRADETGSPDYNLLLSRQRAEQVAEYLKMRGIEDSRITTEGKGEAAPVAVNRYPDGTDAPLGRYLNRQVTVTIENPEPMETELTGFYVPSSLKFRGEATGTETSYWFTVQLHASRSSINPEALAGTAGVTEYAGKDGYFRYVQGNYRTFEEASEALKKLRDSGYPDAFIQTLDWYQRNAR